MARFDLLADRSGHSAYLLDIQAESLGYLKSRLIIPVLDEAEVEHPLIRGLQLSIVFEGRSLVVATQLLTTLPFYMCGRKCGSLEHMSHDITAALDFLMQGF